MTNKVTLEDIKAKIKDECYIVLPDGRTTICQLTMENGYTINGYSACVDAANFNIDLGRKYAYEDAIRQIWPLEGYLLAEVLYTQRCCAPETNWTVSVNDKGDMIATKKEGRATIIRPPKTDPAAWGFKKDGTPKKRPGRAPRKEVK